MRGVDRLGRWIRLSRGMNRLSLVRRQVNSEGALHPPLASTYQLKWKLDESRETHNVISGMTGERENSCFVVWCGFSTPITRSACDSIVKTVLRQGDLFPGICMYHFAIYTARREPSDESERIYIYWALLCDCSSR